MSSSDQIQALLDAKPAKRTTLIYMGVIISLTIHVFILGITFLLTAAPIPEAEKQEEAAEEIELSFEEPETTPEEDPYAGMSEEVRDLLANAESKRTDRQVSYSAKSAEEIQNEVEQSLRDLEKNEFENLGNGRPKTQTTPPPLENPPSNKSNPKSGENTSSPSRESYAGTVSAEFSLSGRNPKSSPRPTYRCKGAGKVIVKIEVSPAGEVISATADPSSSNIDCLREESVKYALRWKFDYNDKAQKRQNGTITFTFSGQK